MVKSYLTEVIELEIEKLWFQRAFDFKLNAKNAQITYFPELEDYAGFGIRTIYHTLAHSNDEAIYPADWWQAFKQRWFPGWLLSRYPVRYERIVATHMFPEAAVPELGKEVVRIHKKAVYEYRPCPL